MPSKTTSKLSSGVFITFSGNCKQALTFYQSCFGGSLEYETFDQPLNGFVEKPVISGRLFADTIVIHGSDLVHDEGRRVGNNVGVFLECADLEERKLLTEKLRGTSCEIVGQGGLVEIIDVFDVRWILSVAFKTPPAPSLSSPRDQFLPPAPL